MLHLNTLVVVMNAFMNMSNIDRLMTEFRCLSEYVWVIINCTKLKIRKKLLFVVYYPCLLKLPNDQDEFIHVDKS